MKNLIQLFALLLLSASALFSQTTIPLNGIKGTTPASLPQKPSVQSSMNTFYIDYDSAEAVTYGTQYKRLMHPMNKYYTATDSAAQFCIVAFDSLYDTYNNTGYPLDSVTSLGIDSLFLFLGQENNSGTDDTLVVRILPVDAFGYPTQNNLNQYWWTVIVLPSFNPLSANWTQPVMIPLFPNVIINDNQFCVKIEYWGNTLDTLGFMAGYGDLDSCGTMPTSAGLTQFSAYNLTTNNTFNANSFVSYSEYPTFGILPTASGSHIYYDCDNSLNYTPGTDGETFIQNISLIAKVTTNDVLSVNEQQSNLVSLSQNFPNPFSDKTILNYQLTTDAEVTITVYDVTGKQILSFPEGNKITGKHSLEINAHNLEAGIYFYTITANGISTTGKMTVVK